MSTTHDQSEHWKSSVGQMTAASWPIAYRRNFTSNEVAMLRAGLWPSDMDDRWVIWLDDQVLRLWRSWTRTCIYEVPLDLHADGSASTRVARVLDSDDYRRSSTEDGELHRLDGVLSLLLSKDRVASRELPALG